MLALKNRLTNKVDFARVRKRGKMFPSESFSLVVYDRKDSNPSRFGFIASTKVSPHSTRRNFIKRILGEAMTQNMYSVKDGYDGVFLVKASAGRKYTHELMPEVALCIKKAGITK